MKPVKGLEWHVGAIGTASFGGVLLKDVLEYAGLSEGDQDVAHIHFIGATAVLAIFLTQSLQLTP